MAPPTLDPRRPLRAAVALLASLIPAACEWFATPKPPTALEAPVLAELIEPDANIAERDLFCGPGGCKQAPRPDESFQFRARHNRGVSPNIVVEDASGRQWNAKLGAEVKPEIAASRLLWAIGFHQPPMYYVSSWTLAGDKDSGPQPEARFRLERHDWKKGGEWEWQDNPFVGARELRGLIVAMVMINNGDLKTSNNVIYERRGSGTPAREYVVKDLGESFGHTPLLHMIGNGENDSRAFDEEGFIKRVDGGRVEFYFQPILLNLQVTRNITVDDVVWTCRRLAELSERQWGDVFRAAGYSEQEAAPFIARMKQKVREGLALVREARS